MAIISERYEAQRNAAEGGSGATGLLGLHEKISRAVKGRGR